MAIEKGGMPVTAGIMKSDPFKPPACRFGDINCLVTPEHDCMDQNTVYQIKCQEPDCLDSLDRRNLYIGQSGRSMHARGKEHARGLLKDDQKCPLTKHKEDFHPDIQNQPKFLMERIRKCRGNIERLLTESQKIGSNDTPDRLMNSKMEYGKNKMIRYRPTIDRV